MRVSGAWVTKAGETRRILPTDSVTSGQGSPLWTWFLSLENVTFGILISQGPSNKENLLVRAKRF